MKGSLGVRYRLSPNEEAQLIKNEREQRRKTRLLQVREQAKVNAANIRQAVKSEKSKQIKKLANEIQNQWENENKERTRKLEDLYISNLKSVGEGHRLAAQHEQNSKQDMRTLLAEEDKRRAQERHKHAIHKHRQNEELKHAEDNKHIFARQAVLEIEKIRASDVARRPPPPPDPVNSIEPVRVKPVQFTDLDAFSATHFHIPSDSGVSKANESEQIDAKVSAEEEERKIRDLDWERKRLEIERKEKARLRHKHALGKEIMKTEYSQMMHDLSDLQRADRTRRQQVVHKVPKQIFQHPHRRLEEKEDQQNDMERAFEDMYMAATDFMGDLSLALDPHPPPDTPTASGCLDLSVVDDSKEVNEDQSDAERRPPCLPPLRAQLEAKDRAKDSTLKKLFEKIKNQREEWISKSSIDNSTDPDPSEISSDSSAPIKTLTQYTVTSGESANSVRCHSVDESLSTGEVSSKTVTHLTNTTEGSCSSKNAAVGTVPLEEGSITSSDTVMADENTLLHPMEKANRVRNIGKEEDMLALIVEEKQKQEHMHAEDLRVMEETLLHKQELETQKLLIESRIKELSQHAREVHQDLLATSRAAAPYHEQYDDQDGFQNVYQPIAHGSSGHTSSYSMRPDVGFGSSVPNHQLISQSNTGSIRHPVIPSPLFVTTTTVPGFRHEQYPDANVQINTEPETRIRNSTYGEQESTGTSDDSTQVDPQISQQMVAPFEQAHEQMKKIHDYQEHLMKRHRDRQHTLLRARQDLDNRARELLDDSLHQVGLEPIYGASSEIPATQASVLPQTNDVPRNDPYTYTSVTATPGDTEKITTDPTQYEKRNVARANEKPTTNMNTIVEPTHQTMEQQFEDIERQKQEILSRDQYHREQIDRLNNQWHERVAQARQLGDDLGKHQLQSASITHSLNQMQSSLIPSDDVQTELPVSTRIDEPAAVILHDHMERDPQLSVILEQESHYDARHVSILNNQPDGDFSRNSSLPLSEKGTNSFRALEQRHFLDGSRDIAEMVSSPDLEAESIEAFGIRLAQIQQDFGQLTAQVNSYLEDPAETTDKTLADLTVEQIPMTNSDGGSPKQVSQISSAQYIIDEIISPLKSDIPDHLQSSMNRDHKTGSSNTWHKRLMRPEADELSASGGVDQETPSRATDVFFALRTEHITPDFPHRPENVSHRLSSTPVTRTGMGPSPQFKPLQADSSALSIEDGLVSDSRATSRRARESAVLSEPTQYPMGSDSDVMSFVNNSGMVSKDYTGGLSSTNSPTQHPLSLETSDHERGSRSPVSRYVYLSSVSSSGSCNKEDREELTRRIEATISVHEQLLKESRELRERHSSPVKDSPNLTKDRDSMSPKPNSSAGISEEPNLTLVSDGDTSYPRDFSECGPINSSPNKSHASLTSFEQHEKSLSEDHMDKTAPQRVKYNSGLIDHDEPIADSRYSSCLLSPEDTTGISNNSDNSNELYDRTDAPSASEGITLQDAFLKKKANFIESSTRRKVEALNKAKRSKAHHPSTHSSKLSKTVGSWKKQRSSNLKGVATNYFRAEGTSDPTNIVTVAPRDRKLKEQSMKERTTRLYHQLDEVQQQKIEKDRKETYAQNREKAKDYQKKLEDKMKKKKS